MISWGLFICPKALFIHAKPRLVTIKCAINIKHVTVTGWTSYITLLYTTDQLQVRHWPWMHIMYNDLKSEDEMYRRYTIRRRRRYVCSVRRNIFICQTSIDIEVTFENHIDIDSLLENCMHYVYMIDKWNCTKIFEDHIKHKI